jgi:hypothetical protein
MSVTTQIIFPYMSDARAPAMDVHMTPQDAGMARSFWLILSALLIGVNGYITRDGTITSTSISKMIAEEGDRARFALSLVQRAKAERVGYRLPWLSTPFEWPSSSGTTRSGTKLV